MKRSSPKLNLKTHLALAEKIRPVIYDLIYKKYDHEVALKVVNYVYNIAKDKFDKDDILIQLILKMKKCKKRIRNDSLSKLLSYLDDDYCAVDDETFKKYGYIYYNC